MKPATLIIFASFLVAGCSDPTSVRDSKTADAQSAAMSRSQDEFVTTPAGRYHRTCVHEIPIGARVGKDRVVKRRDGTTYQIPQCTHPVRMNSGRTATHGDDPFPPTTNGWVEYSFDSLSGGDQYRKLTAAWKVPADPEGSYSGAQVYYSFPGLESDEPAIIQPVIQYGSNAFFGGSYWSMTSWICHDNGECDYTTPYTNVSAGDSITGLVTVSNCANGDCDWWITIQDVTKSASRDAYCYRYGDLYLGNGRSS
jgi:hypothetical protein